MLVAVLSAALLYVLFRLLARKIAPKVKRTLHAMRKNMQQRHKRRYGTKGGGRPSLYKALARRVRKASVNLVHRSCKSAGQRILEHSETIRIMLGAAKVVTHLPVKLLQNPAVRAPALHCTVMAQKLIPA